MNRLFRCALHASLAVIISSACCLSAEAQSIGDTMVAYLNGRLNNRVGGGKSWHMATEALRVGAANSIRATWDRITPMMETVPGAHWSR